jgi:hypothetical protein
VPDGCLCASDADCNDPEFPRCVACQCLPECLSDLDCPLAGQVCRQRHCVDGIDCCDNACEPDSQYCDSLTCVCVDLCGNGIDCPQGYVCDSQTGQCRCTQAGCPAGTICDQLTGQCIVDGQPCDPTDPNACEPGFVCDAAQGVCVPAEPGGEGDACFADDECDQAQGLRCDSDVFCILCIMQDPTFEATFTCRFECDAAGVGCENRGRCLLRKTGFVYLCIPE